MFEKKNVEKVGKKEIPICDNGSIVSKEEYTTTHTHTEYKMKCYCCKELRNSMEKVLDRDGHTKDASIFMLHNGNISFYTHNNCEYSYIHRNEVTLRYCPFCGKKICIL